MLEFNIEIAAAIFLLNVLPKGAVNEDMELGGGIQGQEFRLDINGDDISDEELAKYIVEDMRLLWLVK